MTLVGFFNNLVFWGFILFIFVGDGKGIYLFFAHVKLCQHMTFHSFSIAILSHPAGWKVSSQLCVFSCLLSLKSNINSILHIISFLHFFQLYAFSPALLALGMTSSLPLFSFLVIIFQTFLPDSFSETYSVGCSPAPVSNGPILV